MTQPFEDAKDWVHSDRISSASLEETLNLDPGEEVLTWADFTRGWSPSGTLFLTTLRLAWMKWKYAPGYWKYTPGYGEKWPLLGNDKKSIQIRLADVRSCEIARTWYRLLKASLKVTRKDGPSDLFIPVHGNLDARAWKRAINDLAREISRPCAS